jgi:bifunctional enzyme CysN/CysC
MQQVMITAIGHVDHGKSTLLGRLLFDTGSIPQERIASVKARCAELNRPFEYAFLLDALQEEQQKNITIDLCRFHFNSGNSAFILIDAPGHKEFLKNMISGAASADGVVLLVDAAEGMRDQTRRHAYLLGFLGIRQIVVAINKMDRVGYSQSVFEQQKKEVEEYLKDLGLEPAASIPISAKEGVNVAHGSTKMAWYTGPTLLQQLESLVPIGRPEHLTVRFPIQDIYPNSDYQVAVGRIESGTLKSGDRLVFHPSLQSVTVEFVDSLQGERKAGKSVAIAVPRGTILRRGEIGAPTESGPRVSSELKASLFWLGRQRLEKDKEYLLRLTTVEAQVRIRSIRRVIQTESLTVRTGDLNSVEHSEVADVTLESTDPIPHDYFSEIPNTGRIVLIDQEDVAGGGIIIQNHISDSLTSCNL